MGEGMHQVRMVRRETYRVPTLLRGVALFAAHGLAGDTEKREKKERIRLQLVPYNVRVASETSYQLLRPEVTSLVKRAWCLYSVGWIQPTEGYPASRRAAFTSEIMPAITGLLAEVPDTAVRSEPTATI